MDWDTAIAYNKETFGEGSTLGRLNKNIVMLVYPGNPENSSKGTFFPSKSYDKMDKECSVLLMQMPEKAVGSKSIVRNWQDNIVEQISKWLHPK